MTRFDLLVCPSPAPSHDHLGPGREALPGLERLIGAPLRLVGVGIACPFDFLQSTTAEEADEVLALARESANGRSVSESLAVRAENGAHGM